MFPMNIISCAIERAGSASALGRRLGVSYKAVTKWRDAFEVGRYRSIPIERAIQIENEFHGEFTREQIRPDAYRRKQAAA